MYEAYDQVFNGQRYDLPKDYFEPDFREHNLHINDGVAASIAHQKALGGYPCTILRTVHDDDIWYVHGLYHFLPTEMSVLDIYRLNPAGRCVEHWDTVTCLTDDRGEASIAGPPATRKCLTRPRRGGAKRCFARSTMRRSTSGNPRIASLAPNYVERNQGLGPLAGLRERATGDTLLDEVRLIGVEGDLACVFSNYRAAGRIIQVGEFFRFGDDGLIAEHWDIDYHVPLEAVEGMRAGVRPVPAPAAA